MDKDMDMEEEDERNRLIIFELALNKTEQTQIDESILQMQRGV